MKLDFDREGYLKMWREFEMEIMDDCESELSEFDNSPEDLACELAYTRYELARAEKMYNELVNANSEAKDDHED